jgi:RimJ/RimL family protein N-acetyltransferase
VTLYRGEMLPHGDVSIGPPDEGAIWHAPYAADVAGAVARWFATAREGDDTCYFTIYRRGEPVGQIFLHDIAPEARTSLVGYHLFQPKLRGRDIGTKALKMLKEFVAESTNLQELVIITSRDNLASQRIAEKCGFRYTGPPREDPDSGLCYALKVSR